MVRDGSGKFEDKFFSSVFIGSTSSSTAAVEAARLAEADVQRRQAEDLPATGLRGDNDDTGAGCRV